MSIETLRVSHLISPSVFNVVVLSDQEAAGVLLSEFSRNFSAVSNERLSDIVSDFNASQLYFNCNVQMLAEAMHNCSS